MGRATRKNKSSAAPRQHWSETHPDRHLWTEAQRVHAEMQTQAEYEVLYGRENAAVDLRISSPSSRQHVSEVLRLFAAGRTDDFFSIVRNYGLPEPDSFLEKVYKRAFAVHAKNTFRDQLGISLRQKDPMIEELYSRGRDQFYLDIVRAADGEAPLASDPPIGWEPVLFGGSNESVAGLRGAITYKPFSEANPEIMRGLLRESSAWPGALDGALRREALDIMKKSIQDSRFYQKWLIHHQVMSTDDKNDSIRILRSGSASPLLHLRDPQNRYMTVCGKDRLGKSAKGDSWFIAGEGDAYKRCSDCETGLEDIQGPEADQLREELENRGHYLQLYKISEAEQDALLEEALHSPEVQEALRLFRDGGDAQVVSDAIFNKSAQFMHRLEEMQRSRETKRDPWEHWKKQISYTQRGTIDADLLDDQEFLEEVFTPTLRKAVWNLEMRARAASLAKDHARGRKISKAISHICTHAALRVAGERKQKPAQTSAAASQ